MKYIYPQTQETEYVYKKIHSKFSLIIEGISISTCMTDGEAANLFWYLIQRSRSLICCRSSPNQKSQIVEFIKRNSSEDIKPFPSVKLVTFSEYKRTYYLNQSQT